MAGFESSAETICVKHKLISIKVIDVLTDLFILCCTLVFIRSDKDPEFVAEAEHEWIKPVGAQTAHTEMGLSRKNSYAESFNARLRGKLLKGATFYSFMEEQIFIEQSR